MATAGRLILPRGTDTGLLVAWTRLVKRPARLGFALQLGVLARPGDVLIVYSGSGNSPNIRKALDEIRRIGTRSYAVLGYSGGKAMANAPTHVVNFAAQSMVGESWQNPDRWMMTNFVSMVRLHERLRRYDGLERYVHVTTPAVYGSTEGWIRGDHPFNLPTPYVVSRAAGDMSLRSYHQAYGFPVVSTRAASVYGPGQRPHRIVPRTVLAAIGRRCAVNWAGDRWSLPEGIDDVVAWAERFKDAAADQPTRY